MHLYRADMHLHYVDILMDFLQKEYIYSAFVWFKQNSEQSWELEWLQRMNEMYRIGT